MSNAVAEAFAAWTTIIKRQILLTAIITVAAFFLKDTLTAAIWLLGCSLGVVDSILTFRGIRKGMKESPKRAVAVMQRTMFVRMSVLFLFSFVMLRMGLNVFPLAMGFILMHIYLLINLIIIANRNLKNGFVKKGE